MSLESAKQLWSLVVATCLSPCWQTRSLLLGQSSFSGNGVWAVKKKVVKLVTFETFRILYANTNVISTMLYWHISYKYLHILVKLAWNCRVPISICSFAPYYCYDLAFWYQYTNTMLLWIRCWNLIAILRFTSFKSLYVFSPGHVQRMVVIHVSSRICGNKWRLLYMGTSWIFSCFGQGSWSREGSDWE